MRRKRAGFTLIEMLGVLAIMALLSAAASVMLSGARHAANLRDGIERIEQADASSRILARASDQPIALAILLTAGSLDRRDGVTTTMLARLPGDVKIERIRVGAAAADFGSFDIPFSSNGIADTYAIRLASSTGEKQWILFAGLTGQMLKVDDDDIDAILQQTSGSTRSDTH